MEYESIILKDEITVRKIYTIHYFEYMKNFEFSGETHDFWELQCVYKGEIKVLDHILKAGQVIFHKPNEFHNVLIVMAAVVALMLLYRYLGTILSLAIFFPAFMLYLGERSWKAIVIYDVVSLTAIYFIFEKFLGSPLARPFFM